MSAPSRAALCTERLGLGSATGCAGNHAPDPEVTTMPAITRTTPGSRNMAEDHA